MITEELLLKDIQTDFIRNISHWDIFDDFADSIRKEYGACHISFSFTNPDDLILIWKYLQPSFRKIYNKFKELLLVEYLKLYNDSSWDGETAFYAALWNNHVDKFFADCSNSEFLNMGEDPDGGNYYFSIHGYNLKDTIKFVKDSDGVVTIAYFAKDDPIIGGYGKVPVLYAHVINDMLQTILEVYPNLKYTNGKTALFWHLIGVLDNALIEIGE